MRGGQVLIAVTEVWPVTYLGLEQLGDRHIARLQAFPRAGYADLEHAGAESDWPVNEARAPDRAALLGRTRRSG